MIIFEGPDGAGKSYTAEKLMPFYNDAILFRSKGPTTREEFLSRMRDAFALHYSNPLKTIFCDRFPAISEPVYGPILRGSSKLNDYDLEDWLARLKANGAIIVYCRPSNETLLNVNLESKEHKSPEFVEQVKAKRLAIIKKYDEWMFGLAITYKLNIINFNRDTTPVTRLIKLCAV